MFKVLKIEVIEVEKNAADNINQEDFDSDEGDETSVGDSTIIINYGQVEHCDVCLIAERIKKAFVPCGHSRLCDQCIDTIMEMEHKNYPICRAPVNFVLNLF